MDSSEAINRLKDHFQIHDDGRPTPYLDEAVRLAYDAIEKYDQILNRFGTFDRAMSAELVVHCDKCAYYDPYNILCHRYGLEKPIIMIDQGYCSCGIDKDVFNAMMEHCRANEGWCTPGLIITKD